MTTLADLLNKRPCSKIEKLYPGVTTKPISELTVSDLNNIGLHIMYEEYSVAPSNAYIPAEALKIIGKWAFEQKKSI